MNLQRYEIKGPNRSRKAFIRYGYSAHDLIQSIYKSFHSFYFKCMSSPWTYTFVATKDRKLFKFYVKIV